MTSKELRQKYLDFFRSKGHSIISSASLIPENDPTVLFTTAGMHPLVPYLLGAPHPAGRRLADAQKCIRTGDIDEVGDRTHHTFFEMMGNWSLGDYFKEESIRFSWEFLTSPDWLALDPNRLAVSVFAGDNDAPFDEESYCLWQGLGIPEKRIAKLPKKNNWWGPAGSTGPCGPDTEIFYWTGDEKKVPDSFNDDHESWVEIWNNVFMGYNKTVSGNFEALSQKNVDTGFGLERVTAILNGFDDNYRSDLFSRLIAKLQALSGLKYADGGEAQKSMRIVSDHIKAATFIIGDDRGVTPSNTDQGYVVRRLIRRAIRHSRLLGINKTNLMSELAGVVVDDYSSVYPELLKNSKSIFDNLNQEEEKFVQTLERGLKEFDKILTNNSAPQEGGLSPAERLEKIAFMLYQSFGFPLEMIIEEARSRDIKINEERLSSLFLQNLAQHQELSRTASAGRFKGGLADAGEETTKLHTATHLLLAALRRVLGEHVYQRGSNITPERLRLDFNHSEKMSPEQIREVENLVNGAINSDYNVFCQEMDLSEAKERGAMGVFESKYGERVTVYTVSPMNQAGEPDLSHAFSQEICGGPHVLKTGILGRFRIQKEEASSAGVRRIKAVLE